MNFWRVMTIWMARRPKCHQGSRDGWLRHTTLLWFAAYWFVQQSKAWLLGLVGVSDKTFSILVGGGSCGYSLTGFFYLYWLSCLHKRCARIWSRHWEKRPFILTGNYPKLPNHGSVGQFWNCIWYRPIFQDPSPICILTNRSRNERTFQVLEVDFFK